MKTFYYVVNLPENLSMISEKDLFEVTEDVDSKYNGLWLKITQKENFGNYSYGAFLYNENRFYEIRYKGWILKPKLSSNNEYGFSSNWNTTGFSFMVEDCWGNNMDMTGQFHMTNTNTKDRNPAPYFVRMIHLFAEVVNNYRDIEYYELLRNSEKREFSKLRAATSKYSEHYMFVTEEDKIAWIENQIEKCKFIKEEYSQKGVFPTVPISLILKRYEDALKEAKELFSDEDMTI